MSTGGAVLSRRAPSVISSASGNTTLSASAVAWLNSASLDAPPRPGVLGRPIWTSTPTTAAPARDRLVIRRERTARSHGPEPNLASLAASRATTTSSELTGAGRRSQRS